MFDGASDFKTASKENAVVAGTLSIVTDSSGSKTPTVVVAVGDGAGIMVTTDAEKSAQSILDAISVSKM